MTRILSAIVLLFLSSSASAQPATYPAPVEADFVARDFGFASGERLPEVKIHYRTVGAPRKDADGVVHRVHVNNYLGQNYGRITAIAEDHIDLVELIPNGTGGWMERQATIALGDK